mgnify:CR=1 FL=1
MAETDAAALPAPEAETSAPALPAAAEPVDKDAAIRVSWLRSCIVVLSCCVSFRSCFCSSVPRQRVCLCLRLSLALYLSIPLALAHLLHCHRLSRVSTRLGTASHRRSSQGRVGGQQRGEVPPAARARKKVVPPPRQCAGGRR